MLRRGVEQRGAWLSHSGGAAPRNSGDAAVGGALGRDRAFAARERAAAHERDIRYKNDRDLNTDMRYRFIEDHRADYPVMLLCDALGVSRVGYYA